MYKSVLLVTVFALTATGVFAQRPSRLTENTWDLAGGLAVQRETDGTFDYGWNASIAERPYPSHTWVGGAIESSGVYRFSTPSVPGAIITRRTSLYTAMAGPLAVYPSRHARPFAHALFGGVVTNSTTTGSPAGTLTQTDAYFGHMLGGGLDLSVSKHVSIRMQADWLRVWQSDFTGFNRLHTSGGLVYSF